MSEKKYVKGYRDLKQTRKKLTLETYEYEMPFNYDNIHVFRKYYSGSEFHSIELEPSNPSTTFIAVEQCPANEWFERKIVFEIPPMTEKLRMRIDGFNQNDADILLVDRVMASVVPQNWDSKCDEIPADARNELSSADFSEIDVERGWPAGWNTIGLEDTGTVEMCDEGKSGKAVRFKGPCSVSLYQDINVEEGARYCFAVRMKSSTGTPTRVKVVPQFLDRHGILLSDKAGDCILVREDSPIVRVAVIGSACTPPGYVQLECDEIESWRRNDEVRSVMPVRFRINNLWGYHLRFDQWKSKTAVVRRIAGGEAPYEVPPCGAGYVEPQSWGVKASFNEFPLAGMSSAIFEIPPSRKVLIRGGSEMPSWSHDNCADDGHYGFRIIRTSVMAS